METSDVCAAKAKLFETLGSNTSTYLKLMKLWFSTKTTKENFDFEARKLFAPENIHVHNNFLLAILNKCQTLGSDQLSRKSLVMSHVRNSDKKENILGKRNHKQANATFRRRFQTPAVAQYLPPAVMKPSNNIYDSASLTDIQMVHGRMFVVAWEHGLDHVSDDAVKLLTLAVESFLKRTLFTILSKRNSYKIRENVFHYAIGYPSVNIYLQNAKKLRNFSSISSSASTVVDSRFSPYSLSNMDWAEGEVALALACDDLPSRMLPPVSAFELFNALNVMRNTIPSHTVYAINMERIITKLSHPSVEELEQDNISKQETSLRQELEENMFTEVQAN